jgi:hypothetical protein
MTASKLAPMSDGMKKLPAFPRHELIEEALFSMRTRELALFELLGPPTQNGDPLTADPCFYWDLVWECGLVMAVEFHQLTEETVVHLSADEIEHALRHLEVPIAELVVLRDSDPARFASLVTDTPARNFELWRRDADDRRECIEEELTERDAMCREMMLNGGLAEPRFFAQVRATV